MKASLAVLLLLTIAFAVGCGEDAPSSEQVPEAPAGEPMDSAGSASASKADAASAGAAQAPPEEAGTSSSSTGKAEAHTPDQSGSGHSEGEPGTKHSDGNGHTSSIALGSPGEFDLVPIAGTVGSGTQTFALTNGGNVEHEVIFIRTDLGSGDLPPDGNGGASEEGAVVPHGDSHGDGVQASHVGTHVAAGESGVLTVDLEPGRYAVICNLPGHYAQGMHANIEVSG